jgi:hypothetical protein
VTIGGGEKILSPDILALQASSSTKGLVRLIASAVQSIPHNTNTALSFTGAESIDTNGWHNPASNDSRITPDKAGYFLITGTAAMSGRTDYGTISVWIRKNGATNIAPAVRINPPAISQITGTQVSTRFDANGTTDYFEVVVLHTNTAAVAVNTNNSAQFSCAFEVEYLRPL